MSVLTDSISKLESLYNDGKINEQQLKDAIFDAVADALESGRRLETLEARQVLTVLNGLVKKGALDKETFQQIYEFLKAQVQSQAQADGAAPAAPTAPGAPSAPGAPDSGPARYNIDRPKPDKGTKKIVMAGVVTLLVVAALVAAALFVFPTMQAKKNVKNTFAMMGLGPQNYGEVSYDYFKDVLEITAINGPMAGTGGSIKMDSLTLMAPKKIDQSTAMAMAMGDPTLPFKGISVKGMDLNMGPALGVNVSLGEYTMSGMEPGKMGLMSLTGLHFVSGQHGMVSCDNFRIENLTFPPELFAMGGMGPAGPDPSMFSPENFNMDLFLLEGLDLKLHEVNNVTVGSLEMRVPAREDGKIGGTMDLKNLVLDAEKFKDLGLRSAFVKAGLGKLVVGLHSENTWDPVTKEGADSVTLTVAKGGVLTSKSVYHASTPFSPMSLAGEGDQGFGDMAFKSFTLTLKNETLMDLVFTLAGKKQGLSPEAFQDKLVQNLLQQADDPLAPAETRENLKALAAFLENPGELTIEARPTTPVSLDSIMDMVQSDPARLAKELNAVITAKPKS